MGANVSKLRDVVTLVGRANDHVTQVQNDFNTCKDTFTELKDAISGLAGGSFGIGDAVKIVDVFSGAVDKKEQVISMCTGTIGKCEKTVILLKEAQETLAAAQACCVSQALAIVGSDDPELAKLASEIPDLAPQNKRLQTLDQKIQDSGEDLLVKLDVGKDLVDFYAKNSDVVLPMVETFLKSTTKIMKKMAAIKNASESELVTKGPQLALCVALVQKIQDAVKDFLAMLRKTKDVAQHFQDSMPKDLGDAALELAKGVGDKIEGMAMSLLGGA